MAVSLCGILLFSGCMSSTATGMNEEDIEFLQLEEIEEGRETAVITTTEGTITMILYEKEAPNTVAHFKKLIAEGFYNDLPVYPQAQPHTFVTGATNEIGSEGKVATEDGKPLTQEITPNLWHFRGAVSAYGYEKNKFSSKILSDSRFFIVGDIEANNDMVTQMEEYDYPQKVIDAYKENGGLPQYTGVYTVFGQVIDGLDVVDRIAALPYDELSGQANDARVISIELSTYHKADAAE